MICKVIFIFAGVSALLLPVIDATYIGCYFDQRERDLSFKPNHNIKWQMSTDGCIALCKRDGFKYAGIQWGIECWCGDSYGRYGNASESTCSVTCRGNREQKCGGHWRNSVHTTLDCPHNQEYQVCGSSCPRQCGVEPEHCILMCVEGCGCPAELPVMTKDGLCVVEQDCPPDETVLPIGSLWLRGDDSYISMPRGDFLTSENALDYVGFTFKPQHVDGMIFFVGSSKDQYMALELVNDTLIAHWNFGFPNGSMEETVQLVDAFTQMKTPAIIRFGISHVHNRVVLSINLKIAVSVEFNETYSPDIIGDLHIGGLPPDAEESIPRPIDDIPELYHHYRGWIKDLQVNGLLEDAQDAIASVGVTVGQCEPMISDCLNLK